MQGMPELQTYRDKDIAKLVGTLPRGRLGLIGSDVVVEQGLDRRPDVSVAIVEPVASLRFALAARSDRSRSVAEMLESGQEIRVGTSYAVMTQRIAEDQGMPLRVVLQADGQVERLANSFPDQIDAVVDMVRTGKSLLEQNLQIVADDLAQVSLCAIWRQATPRVEE